MDETTLEKITSMIYDGKYQSAVTEIETILRTETDEPLLHALLSLCLLESGDESSRALSEANAAYRMSQEPFMKYVKGWAMSAGGDIKGGLKYLNMASSEDPENVQYLVKLAEVQESQEDLNGALKSIIRAQKIDGDNIQISILKAGILNKLERHSEAKSELRRAIDRKPDFDYSHFIMAETLIALNEMEGAESEVSEAIRLSGGSYSEYHEMLAGIQLARNRPDLALGSIDDAISHALSDDESHGYQLEKARILESLERPQEAEIIVKSLYGNQRDSPLMFFALIDFLANQKRKDEMESLLAERQLPDKLVDLVRFYAGYGRVQESEELINLISESTIDVGEDPFLREFVEILLEVLLQR